MRFLLFRLPQEKDFFWIEHQENAVEKASFFPFVEGEILSLNGEMKKIEKGEIYEKLSFIKALPQPKNISIPSKEEYLEKIENTISEIYKNNWQKLVISRPVEFYAENIDLADVFFSLCDRFPQAFCSIWKDENCLWIGATPELLGKFDKEKSIFETMSLAGTLPIDEDWTEKEIEEQRAVSDYIASVLGNYANEIEIGKVKNHYLQNIKHLRTDFKIKINIEKLESLIRELHPTPAVCGIPKEKCMEKILEIEGYDREYYTGYIRVESVDKIYFFVNLRCMQVFENKIIAYAGGGITPKSLPEKEWQETEMKIKSIIKSR